MAKEIIREEIKQYRIEMLLRGVFLAIISGVLLAFIEPVFGWRSFAIYVIGVTTGVLSMWLPIFRIGGDNTRKGE